MLHPRRHGSEQRQLFFFQAEDGIRDPLVTGVQTCALPILSREYAPWPCTSKTISLNPWPAVSFWSSTSTRQRRRSARSEERRVGKEWRSRWRLYPAERKAWDLRRSSCHMWTPTSSLLCCTA